MVTTKTWQIFSVLILLKTTTADNIFSNDTSIISTTPSSSPLNRTAEIGNDVIYYACGANSTFCECYANDLRCGRYPSPLKSLNIKLFNQSYYHFKNIVLRVEIDDKLLPGNEQTIERLALSLSKIGSIEDGAFDKFVSLQSLSLMYCNVSSINNQILTKAVGRTLNSLDLEQKAFAKLAPDSFKYLSNLTFLNLAGNNLDDFLMNNGMLPGSLKVLNMGFCEISNLSDDIFTNLKNLETLFLSGNYFTRIPTAIYPLQKLQHLQLVYTKITELHFGEIQTLQNLTTLDLSNIDTLEYIGPFAFYSFPNLTTLDLSYNKNLKSIHEFAFESFMGQFVTKLEDFKINDCNLTVLPENLLPWEKIKSVTISPNPFACNCSMAWLINDFINPKPKYYKTFHGELPRCQSPPELEGQTFQEVSGTVCFERNTTIDNRNVVCDENERYPLCKCTDHEISCSSLAFRFLSSNLKIKDSNYTLKKISFVHYPIYALKRGEIMRGHEHTIEEIDLDSTRIEKIENGTFDDFTSLKILRITRHSLKMVDENILTESLGKTLIELDLDGNISLTAFKHLKKLEILNFWKFGKTSSLKKELFPESLKNLTLNTYLKSVDNDLFDNLVNLEELYLTFGSLTSVPVALNALPKLRTLDISYTNIAIFDTQNLTTVFNKLKILKMESMRELTSIEDCAFCPFPNLEELYLSSSKVEFIHENAFGYASVLSNDTLAAALNETSKISKLKKFTARYCKLSTLPENLLPWDTVKEIKIDGNPFICDCSLAWLINDNAKECPQYIPHLRGYYNMKCDGPAELKEKSFQEISSKNCSTNFTTDVVFDESTNCTLKLKQHQKTKPDHYYSNSDINYVILFVTIVTIIVIIVIVGAVTFYFYRRKQIAATSTSVQQAIDKLNVEMSMSILK